MGRYLTQGAERSLDTDGYAVFEEVVGPTIVGGLVKHLQTDDAAGVSRQRGGSTFGVLLHASHSAASPGHRRVIHLEFSGGELPAPLRWHVA